MDMLKAQQRIREQIAANKEAMVQTLSQVVQIPSVTGNEGEAQKYMTGLYQRLGLKVITFEPDKDELARHPSLNRILDTDFKGRPNVLGILEGEKTARSINLNGHIDTVPPDPIDQWVLPPFSGQVEGDRLYGRGAEDNKGGLISNYYALKGILDAGFKPQGKVMLESAVEEEIGGGGTLTTMLRGYITEGMICNDGPPGVLIAHTGGIGRLVVRVIGRTMHTGWADLGVNAIIKMNLICAALDDLGKKRTREVHLSVLETPARKVSCTHNISIYRAGDNPSLVPGWAEITASFSIIPGEKVAEVRKQVEDVINRAADNDDWLRENRPQITWFGKGSPGWLQDAEHPFVQMMLDSTSKVTGGRPPLSGMTAGSDVRFTQLFNSAGVLTGPVGIAHAVNEYIEISSMITNAQIIATMITEWCGIEEIKT